MVKLDIISDYGSDVWGSNPYGGTKPITNYEFINYGLKTDGACPPACRRQAEGGKSDVWGSPVRQLRKLYE